MTPGALSDDLPPVAEVMPPGQRRVVLPGGVPFTFQRIPAGAFRMGGRAAFADEEPVHYVRVSGPFYLSTCPVTQAQFAAWTGTEAYATWVAGAIERGLINDSRGHENAFEGKPDHPAERVTWHEARAFCEWMNHFCRAELDQLAPDLTAALPNEAQWEYACRAETDTEYHTGDGPDALDAAGWFAGNAGRGTCPAGAKVANALGLCDMHGNVLEWCADVWDERAYCKRPGEWEAQTWTLEDAGPNAEYWDEESRAGRDPLRVIRGRSWYDSARSCRSTIRARRRAGIRSGDIGFRVCLVPGPFQRGGEETSQAQTATGAEEGGTTTQAELAGGAEVNLTKETMPPAEWADKF